jgi:hypothetical protein
MFVLFTFSLTFDRSMNLVKRLKCMIETGFSTNQSILFFSLSENYLEYVVLYESIQYNPFQLRQIY